MSAHEVVGFDRDSMNHDTARALVDLWFEVWPDETDDSDVNVRKVLDEMRDEAFAGERRPINWAVMDGGRVLAVARTFARTIDTGAGRMTIMALAGVCSHPAVRGRGYGRAVVKAAFSRVDDGVFPVSLFQTQPRIIPYYERFGAGVVGNRFVNSLAKNPRANPLWDPIAMVYPATADWPDGEVDLLGPAY